MNALIQPAMLGIREHQVERVGGDLFGTSGAAWATVYGITLGDANQRSRSRGWSPGMGGWKPPLWKNHPVPLGLDIFCLVRSPSYRGVIGGFEPLDMDRALVAEAFDHASIVAAATEFCAALVESDWDQLVRALSTRFVVEET